MKTINDYADLVKEKHALNKTLAPVETDLTSASRAYAIGQKFIYDGILYKAKTAIVQGAALVLNTNYEAADDFSSEIQTLTKVETVPLTAESIATPDQYNRCKRNGKVCVLNLSASFQTSGEAWAKAFSISSDIAPASDIYFPLVHSQNYSIVGLASVSNNGVYIKLPSTQTDVLRCTVTWLIGM